MAVLLVLGLLGGCAHRGETEIDNLPVIAVLINSKWTEADSRGFTWDVYRNEVEVEQRFSDCVRLATRERDIGARVITATQFRAAIFPDLEPLAAPRRWEVIAPLISDQRFQSRSEAAGIRYLAIVGGETSTSETQGNIACVGGFGAGACLGSLWWDHDSRLSALVVDLRGGSRHEAPDIRAAGSSWFAFLAILPLAAPSAHEGQGCERFGDAVADAIHNMRHKGD